MCKAPLEAQEYSDSGSAEESWVLKRHGQGCVERLRGLGDPKLPLSTPSGVQFAPTSPKLVEGAFSEVRFVGVLLCSCSPGPLPCYLPITPLGSTPPPKRWYDMVATCAGAGRLLRASSR